MWCNRCQQDVPATAQNAGGLTCACCGNLLPRTAAMEANQPAPEAAAAASAAAEGIAHHFCDWRLEDDLREARRLVRMAQAQSKDEPAGAAGEGALRQTEAASVPALAMAPVRRAGGLSFGWLLAGLGFSGLVCGCALLAWSQVAARAELWNAGLPIALVSQAVLVVGVLLLLDFGSAGAVPAAAFAPAASHLHVHSGGLAATGVSVHFSNGPQQSPVDGGQLARQIEAAMRRAA